MTKYLAIYTYSYTYNHMIYTYIHIYIHTINDYKFHSSSGKTSSSKSLLVSRTPRFID